MFNHPKMKMVFVGVDTHRNTHTAVIINCFGEILGDNTFNNRMGEFEDFLSKVLEYTPDGLYPVFGLEGTGASGRALAVFLLGKKYTVKKVNSNLTTAERKSQTILHKTDTFDALCAARVLLSKFDILLDAMPIDIYWTLGTLVKRRESIVKSNTALKNQLHANIIHHYPDYRKFFNVFDCQTALAFWEKYPSPKKLKGVTSEKLGELLHKHSSGLFNTEKAKEILELVKSSCTAETDFQEYRDFIITSSIDEIRHKKEEIQKLEAQIKKLVSLAGYKLESMKGINTIAAAGFISEVGDISRFPSASKFAKYSGIAPVTYASGTTNKNFKSKQGNRRLYSLFHNLAARSINKGRNKNTPFNDMFADYYEKKIKDGKTPHQALICVMRRLSNIIYGLMKNKVEYKHPTQTKTSRRRRKVAGI